MKKINYYDESKKEEVIMLLTVIVGILAHGQGFLMFAGLMYFKAILDLVAVFHFAILSYKEEKCVDK